MIEKKPVKTSLVLPYDLHWGMKRKASEREMGDTAAIREAIQGWIARQPLHALLDAVLASGDENIKRDVEIALMRAVGRAKAKSEEAALGARAKK